MYRRLRMHTEALKTPTAATRATNSTLPTQSDYERLTADMSVLESLEERAAIMQYDGLMSQEDAERSAFELYYSTLADRTISGLAALLHFAQKGIALIGAYESGATIAGGDEYDKAFTIDTKRITELYKTGYNGQPINRFYFIPQQAGFICLDIDRKKGKQDGLQSLYNEFGRDTLPAALAEIESFPCYVTTPSGGLHLYFKYNGEPIKSGYICPEVEVKHGKPGLTAPGSSKDGKPYILHGNLEDAPPLYGIILERLTAKARPAERRRAPRKPQRYTFTEREPITLDKLAAEAAEQEGGNHSRQVVFAGKVTRLQNARASKGLSISGYTMRDALNYVQDNPDMFGTGSDTESTIKSIFTDNGAE